MLKNYFKIARRNLINNKGYSTINILGLSLGITCCLILFIIVRFELSFDSFHPNADRIYRVVTNFTQEDGLNYNPARTNSYRRIRASVSQNHRGILPSHL